MMTIMIRLCHYSFFCILFVVAKQNAMAGNADSQLFKGALVTSDQLENKLLKSQFSNFRVFQLNIRSIYHYINSNKTSSKMNLQFGDAFNWNLELKKNDLRSPGYTMLAASGSGIEKHSPAEINTYKGYVTGESNSSVRLTITEHEISGFIRTNNELIYIEPVKNYSTSASESSFVVYNNNDVINNNIATCLSAPSHKFRATEATLMESIKAHIPKSSLTCKRVDMAVGADYIFTNWTGSKAAAEQKILTVLNLVEGHYEPFEVKFNLIASYISNCSSCDPWTSSSEANTLREDFKNWAEAGGFGTNGHDVATLYTGKNIRYGSFTGTIGLSYSQEGVALACTDKRYNIIEVQSSDRYTAVNHAHETGHLWGYIHDDKGSTIMSPVIGSNNSGWTQASFNQISKGINESPCISGCDAPPVADFNSDISSGCQSLTVQFKDASGNSPSFWLWDFGDGNTSSEQNPIHTYSSPGNYTVTLKVSNEFGDHTETKTDLIRVGSGVPYPTAKGGPADSSLGGGAYFSSTNERRLIFDVHEDVIIESVKVYADLAGERAIEILDNTSNKIFLKSVDIPVGASRIQLDAAIPAGNNYAIKVASTFVHLYRNNNGLSYPYAIDGKVTILKSDASSTPEAATKYYYFFYDWAVRISGCQEATVITEINKSVTIFPNPTKGVFQLIYNNYVAESIDVAVYNVLGKVVLNHQLATNKSDNIDITGLPDGTYFVCLKIAGKKQLYQKVVKY